MSTVLAKIKHLYFTTEASVSAIAKQMWFSADTNRLGIMKADGTTKVFFPSATELTGMVSGTLNRIPLFTSSNAVGNSSFSQPSAGVLAGPASGDFKIQGLGAADNILIEANSGDVIFFNEYGSENCRIAGGYGLYMAAGMGVGFTDSGSDMLSYFKDDTFTMTLSANTPDTGTAKYVRLNKLVWLYIPKLEGEATGLNPDVALTGFAAAITPPGSSDPFECFVPGAINSESTIVKLAWDGSDWLLVHFYQADLNSDIGTFSNVPYTGPGDTIQVQVGPGWISYSVDA